MSDEEEEDVVWQGTIDQNTYAAKVVRVDSYQAVLTVTRTADQTIVLNEPVRLSYDARFGPDVFDLHMWQHMATEAVDHDLAQQKRSNPT